MLVLFSNLTGPHRKFRRMTAMQKVHTHRHTEMNWHCSVHSTVHPAPFHPLPSSASAKRDRPKRLQESDHRACPK